jgi:hypothetical protein
MEEAKKLQFWIVDCITNEFQGHEILSRGDLGFRREGRDGTPVGEDAG